MVMAPHFLSGLNNIPLYDILLIHSPVDICLGCFCLFAVESNVMNKQ